MPWTAIRDDTDIQPKLPQTWDDPEEFLRAYLPNPLRFEPCLLDNQKYYMEPYCEAGGMTHQLKRVTHPRGILTTGSGGYNAITGKWQLVRRLRRETRGRPAVVFHLGDADSDGECIYDSLRKDVYLIRAQETMRDDHWQAIEALKYGEAHCEKAMEDAETDEFREWIRQFYDGEADDDGRCWAYDVEFVRVAVTDDQIKHYHLPEEPRKKGKKQRKALTYHAKETQLEAMNPSDIRTELDTAINEYWDPDAEKAAKADAAGHREVISDLRGEFTTALDLHFGVHINDAE